MKLDKIFYWIGYNVSKHPIATISLSVCIVGFIMSGLIFLEFENDPQKLWVPQDSVANREQIFFNTHFGAFYRINQIMLQPSDENIDMDLFLPEYLEIIYNIQTKIESRNITYLDKEYNLLDLCYRPIATQGCLTTSPMEFWKMDLTAMLKDGDVKSTAKCLKTSVSNEIPCMDRIGVPIMINSVFGGSGCVGNETCDSCSLCRKTAKSLMVTFLLNNNFYTNKVAEEWEKTIFIDEIDKFNNEHKIQNGGSAKIKMVYLAERSIPDDLANQNIQNILIVALSYIFMFIYIAVSMGQFPSLILSRFLVAFGGIMVVIFSFLGSIAIVSFLKIKVSLISSEVVPFLVLAIGVDNMFIIVNTKDRKKKEDLNDHMGNTLKEVGPSITTAALSECLAFIIGYLTKIPALQSFCLSASFAILIDYFLQITMFFAIVTLDEIRIREKRYDIMPCFTTTAVLPKPGKGCQNFISKTYFNFLMKTPTKIVIGIIYIGMITVSFVGFGNLTLGLDPRVAVTQHGSLDNFLYSQMTLGEVGPPAYLVFNKIDYNNETNLNIIDELCDDISQLNTVAPPVYSWYKEFKKYMDSSGEWTTECNPNLRYLRTLPLEIQVREFIKVSVESKCCTEYGVCGEPYKDDIYFNEKGIIEATRFRFQHTALVNQTVYIDCIEQTKNVVKNYKDKFSVMDGYNTQYTYQGETFDVEKAYPYSLFYVYYDQYSFIQGVTIENILIALAIIFLAVQVIMNIRSAFTVTLFTFSTIFNIIGIIYLTNFIPDYKIEINALSVVNWVMACGLSVEFTVHIVIFYLRSQHEDNNKRVQYALKNVGVSVLVGIVTTKFIGVSVLLFAPSKVFQTYYFRMYLFLIISGFFHGFMLLPIYLTYFSLRKTTELVSTKLPKRDTMEKLNE